MKMLIAHGAVLTDRNDVRRYEYLVAQKSYSLSCRPAAVLWLQFNEDALMLAVGEEKADCVEYLLNEHDVELNNQHNDVSN